MARASSTINGVESDQRRAASQSLGRAKEISEYINHQFTEGYAEIELYRKKYAPA